MISVTRYGFLNFRINRTRTGQYIAAALLALWVICGFSFTGWGAEGPDEKGIFTFQFNNDMFGRQDQHFTTARALPISRLKARFIPGSRIRHASFRYSTPKVICA